MRDAYIIDTIRTPVGKFGGSLATVRTDDMAAMTIAEIVKRNSSLDPAAIEDVILGCANQAGEDNRNVARMALLLAGLPTSVPGYTVNRLCASGLNSVANAAALIKVDGGDVFIAGGVESMTRAPYVMSKSGRAFGRDAKMWDTSIGWRFPNPRMKAQYGIDGMGHTAENVAEQYNISREDQDQFALGSQKKAAAAREKGRLAKEIMPVSIPQRKGDPIIFDHDEFIRADSSITKLSSLRPVFRTDGEGSVTAGNSSGINDGAAAILLASQDGIKQHGLKPRARILAATAVGLEPRIMGMGPYYATEKILKVMDMKLDDIAVLELNEAFASQSLACMRELGLADDDPRVNPNGGAIAIGHPLGMSGTRIIGSALIELEERQERFALCTMCIGVGQGMAMIIERV